MTLFRYLDQGRSLCMALLEEVTEPLEYTQMDLRRLVRRSRRDGAGNALTRVSQSREPRNGSRIRREPP